MLNRIAGINLRYLTELSRNKDHAIAHYQRVQKYLVEHHCAFGDTPIAFFLKPQFIAPAQRKALAYVVEKMSAVLNKFIALYFREEKVRRMLDFTAAEEALFDIEPGYQVPLVISRLDAFMEDLNIKFLEFNCDSPGGIYYSEAFELAFNRIQQQVSSLRALNIETIERTGLLLDSLLTCYGEFRRQRPNLPETPTVAIVDWTDVPTGPEFVAIQNLFKAGGIETIICDPRDFEIKQGAMRVGDIKVDLIYKRVIMRELLERPEVVETFLQGIREGLACTCNPFRSYVVGNKKILAALLDPAYQSIYTSEELDVIERTVPWTCVLAPGNARHRGYLVNLKDFVISNKDRFVIKAANSYGGKEVFLGNETEQAEWETAVNVHIEARNWVVQERVPIPREIFPVIDEESGNLYLRIKNVNINPFGLLGRYAGTISRVSESSIINVSQGGGIVPTMCVEERRTVFTG
jgi:hypothetical protein